MVTLLFIVFLGIASTIALRDWRRGWLIAIVCGILQDPARKMTPGTPVVMSFSIVAVYLAVLIAARRELLENTRELIRRFPAVSTASVLVFAGLALAIVTGLATFGTENWEAPMLSLFVYLSPVPAVIIGYVYLQREELLYRFFRFYATITSVALIGTIFEYRGAGWRILGLVGVQYDYIRHLPGIQIRMLSGFYRAPDIMSWHAATLTAIGIAMSLRAGVSRRAIPWLAVTAWGFLNSMIGGRRKAIYYVVAFALIFLWRYFRRLQVSQIVALAAAVLLLAGIVRNLASDPGTTVYAQGAATTRGEVFQRLEGGLMETFRQFGILGAGLGSATQGVHHLLPPGVRVGWQEGGLGKLAMELGLPGLLAVLIFAFVLVRLLLRLTSVGDVPGSSQFARVTLFALLGANAVNFAASAQAYTDPVLTLLTAFFAGCLFATATLDERLAAAPSPAATAPQLTSPAPA